MRLAALLLLSASVARAAGVAVYSGELLERASAAGRTVLIQFYAVGCPVCDEQVVALKKIAASESPPAPIVFQADLASEEELARKLGVKAPSALVLLKRGEKIGQVVGTPTEKEIRAFIRESRENARGRPGPRPRREIRPKR